MRRIFIFIILSFLVFYFFNRFFVSRSGFDYPVNLKTHSLRVVNNTDDIYDFYLYKDGQVIYSKVIKSKTFFDFYLDAYNNYDWKYSQLSGYVFFPTEKEGVLYMDGDSNIIISYD